MKKSETEDSTDDVFYSLSSAVSVTASDVTRTPSPTPTSSHTVTTESKANKGLSRLKSFRPRKLIPKRFKSSVGASEVTPEVQNSPLLKSDSESPGEKGKKESKIPRRSKASQIVRRFTFKKGQKVAPKGNEGDEDTSTTSSSTTPMSMKRETPEGTTLSISEQSLCVVEERSVEESSADQSERKSSNASTTSSTKQELKITISGKKIEKLKRLYEKGDDDNNGDNNASKDTTSRSFDELKYDVSATITRDTNTASSFQSTDKTSLNAVMKTRNNSTKNNKKSTTIAPIILPSPPPTPLMSIHIPLKPDTPKPISSTIPMKEDQIPTITATIATTTTRSVSSENKNIVTDSDERPTEQQLVVVKKKESLKAKLINKLNINRSVHDITPTVPAPTVPYKITDTEIINIIGPDAQTSQHKQLTPDEYTKFIKQDREQSFSEQISEKIFTLDDLTDNSMKRSDESDTQSKSKGSSKKRSKRALTQDSTTSPDSGLSTSVHVQEPQKSYQKQSSLSTGTNNEPEITFSVHEEDEVTINKTGEISFRIGTPVRPLPTTQITHITESISIDSSDPQKSLEEISSISSESQSPPLSENSRRKIKYLPQPTLYSSEEQALLEGNFGPPSSFIGSEYSIDYSLNPLSMVDTTTEGTSPVAAATNLTMSSSEKREHLYKILVIGELGTGKTSFIKRYVHQFFSQNYRATIGVDFALKVLNWDPNTIIRLQLWDIAGQERFGNMTRVYYKEAVGAFIVFDVTRTSSFDAVIKWKQDLDSKVQLPDGSSIPCILLANKCDQTKQGIVTTPAKLDEYCKENGFSGWFETSAKENINIDDAAKALVNKILANDKVMNSNEAEMDGFAIDGRDNGTSKKNCAC